MNSSDFIPASEIRSRFAQAMSDMYRKEVPMYGTLVDMVQDINQQELDTQPELRQALQTSDSLHRLSAERHGAIRLGKAEELSMMRRLFAVMGMQAVSYYDLSEAGVPVHSTTFRPLQLDELNTNPFRIFTSLLRLDLIEDQALREQATTILQRRQIFTDQALVLIDTFEQQGGLDAEQAEEFVQQALETFRWHKSATVDHEIYLKFLNTHALIADIVCFRGPHINHLTPRTLNIDAAQQQMTEVGLRAKEIVEGPPKREHPILLRQTSFKALDEDIQFINDKGESQPGSHTARFGEIEQRGMALTPKGRQLYDKLLAEVRQAIPNVASNPEQYYRQLQKTFTQFPDDIQQIRQQGLGYFRYLVNATHNAETSDNLQQLVDDNILQVFPITYEDFLPVSAAGIFHSNLHGRDAQDFERSPNQQAFEEDLGCPVVNEFEFYASIQRDSLLSALQKLGLNETWQQNILQQLQDQN